MGVAKLTGEEYMATDAAIDFTVGFATSGISAISKFGKVGLTVMKEGLALGIDIAAAEWRAYAKGEDFDFKKIAIDTAKNAIIVRRVLTRIVLLVYPVAHVPCPRDAHGRIEVRLASCIAWSSFRHRRVEA